MNEANTLLRDYVSCMKTFMASAIVALNINVDICDEKQILKDLQEMFNAKNVKLLVSLM